MAVSMHGLDLSFLKTEDSQNRLRWERNRAEECKRSAPVSSKRSDLYSGKGMLLPDLDVAYNGGFVSPIDGTFISSRSQLREHNKRHGVIQTGDIRGEEARERTRKRMGYDPSLIGHESFSWVKPDR